MMMSDGTVMGALLKLAAEMRRKGQPFYPTRSRYQPFYSVYSAAAKPAPSRMTHEEVLK